MSTPSSNQYFEAVHQGPGTPSDPNLFSASEIVAGSFDSGAVSTATSKAVSTVNAAAPDSTSISQARSQAVSAASVGSVADSKSVSNSVNISVADSKGVSGSFNTSIADSKAVSVGTSTPVVTALVYSANISIADSKATSSAAALVTSVSHRKINFKDAPYNGVGDGVTDNTAAFATLAAAGGRIEVEIPSGTYLTSDETVFSSDRINIRGAGQQATIIKFAPTSTGKACFHFKKPTSALMVQWSVRGIAFDASGNTQGTKSAIRSTDGEEVIIDDIAVSNWSSVAKDCIGLQLRGRQTHSISNYVINCDLPISIEDNPNSTIDIDHYHFWNGYTIADPSQPNIKIASGVNLSNVTFDGYQAWVIGSDGLYWVDTTSAQISQNLAIKNVRWEQSTSPTGYMVRIEHNVTLNTLVMENCSGGANTLGVKLRGMRNASLRNVTTLNTSGTSLDVDATDQPLILDNCFFQTGGTVSVGTLKKVYDSGVGIAGGGTGSYVIYHLPSAIRAARTQVPFFGDPVTVAQDATATIGVANNTTGYVIVITDEHVMAWFRVTGTVHTVIEGDDNFGFFSITKDTASSYNLYYEAPNFVIQNKRTGSKVISWLVIGDTI